MNEKNNISDQEIEEYLKGETELSATYAQSKELKAPDHLEFSVKRMARDAEHKTSSQPTAGKDVWLVPLSIAATVIIAISITFFIDFNTVENHSLIADNKNSSTEESVIQEVITPQQQTADISDEVIIAPEVTVEPGIKVKAQTKQTTAISVAKPETHKAGKKEQLAEENSDFELPPHLQAIVQTTGAGSSDELLPAEILKTWTRLQWKQQIAALKNAGKEKLATQYIEQYPAYYPGETLPK